MQGIDVHHLEIERGNDVDDGKGAAGMAAMVRTDGGKDLEHLGANRCRRGFELDQPRRLNGRLRHRSSVRVSGVQLALAVMPERPDNAATDSNARIIQEDACPFRSSFSGGSRPGASLAV